MTAEEKKLFEDYKKTQDIALRNKIVEKYIYLVEYVAKKYVNKGIDYDDLYQVGCYGLIMAAQRFDANVGVKFSTYAVPTIMGEIRRYFRDKGYVIRLPRKLYDVFQKANRIRLSRMQYDGYVPTIDEISEVLKLPKKDVSDAMVFESVVNVFSLDKPIYDEEAPALGQIIGYDNDDFLVVENKDFIYSGLKKLTKEERRLIILRYYRNKTQREIAQSWNVSQMYVSRLERKTLEKLKKMYLN